MSTKFFKLPALAEILAGGQKVVDAALAPLKARKVRAQAETMLVSMDEDLIRLERDIVKKCASDEIDFAAVLDLRDEHAMVTLRKAQLQEVVDQLFPSDDKQAKIEGC